MKYRSCPGEDTCVHDKDYGEIAQLRETTDDDISLETYCKEGECPFYKTKPENFPQDLREALETGQRLREEKEASGNLELDALPYFEVVCLLGVNRGCNRAEVVDTDETTTDNK